MPVITLQDVKSGTSYNVKEGTTLQQVYEEYGPKGDMPIAAALYNNECVGLKTKVIRAAMSTGCRSIRWKATSA